MAAHSLQEASSSVMFWGLHSWTQLFSKAYRFSIGFRSGDWLGHYRTLMRFVVSHASTLFAVCLGSLLCWNPKRCPKHSSHTETWRFSANISLYITPFILPSTWTRWPVPELEKQPHSMMLPPPCFTVGMVFRGLNASPFFHLIVFLVLWLKSSIFVLSDHSTLSHWARESETCAQANLRRAARCLLDLSGTFHGWCTATPILFTALVTVDFETWMPTAAKSSLMASCVAVGLIFARTPTFEAAWPCNFHGRPFWGTFTFVLSVFQQAITPWMVEHGTPNIVETLM